MSSEGLVDTQTAPVVSAPWTAAACPAPAQSWSPATRTPHPQTSHVAAWLKPTKPRWTVRKRSQAGQRPAPMTQRVHPIPLASSPVPQTLNNLAARWQASITTLACSYSLRRLKRTSAFLTVQTCCRQSMIAITWSFFKKCFDFCEVSP